MTKHLPLFLLFAFSFFLSHSFSESTQDSDENSSTANQTIEALMGEYHTLNQSTHYRVDHPVEANRVGRFEDVSPSAHQKRSIALFSILQRLEKLSEADLSEKNRINRDLLAFLIVTEREWIEHEAYLFPMVGDTGFYFELLMLGSNTQIGSEADAQFYWEKLNDIPRFLQQWQTNLQLAIKAKKVMPAVVLKDFEKPLQSLIDGSKESPLLAPVKGMKQKLPEEKAKAFEQKITASIQQKVTPAIQSFIDFVTQEYLPKGRPSIAINDIPRGGEFYQSQIRYYTTMDMTADKIHHIGLSEVRRIRAEMEAVIKASGFTGTFAEFIEFLRTDEQFYAKSPEALLKEAAYFSKKADAMLPKFFTRLPRQPYGVEPVPEAIAPRYTTGRYVGAPLESTRPGLYWVNTYALDKRPLYVLEALTLHEAVPGHHLQSALTKELDNFPEFRKRIYLSAFGEGWALYCEKLGIEGGFYQNPYSQFGRLTYEMWRAIRLVVDTGMHTKGWSREKAIRFMEENTALSKHNVRTEIDRYIAWPGQALSYKMGELKIVELRQKAEKALGYDFDIRRFHDTILMNGPVTLPMLETIIEQWIEQERLTLQ